MIHGICITRETKIKEVDLSIENFSNNIEMIKWNTNSYIKCSRYSQYKQFKQEVLNLVNRMMLEYNRLFWDLNIKFNKNGIINLKIACSNPIKREVSICLDIKIKNYRLDGLLLIRKVCKK